MIAGPETSDKECKKILGVIIKNYGKHKIH